MLKMKPTELPEDELKALAREWRARALRGEMEARGIAHELEREVRRRFPTFSARDSKHTLDMRPFDCRQQETRSHLKFWWSSQ